MIWNIFISNFSIESQLCLGLNFMISDYFVIYFNSRNLLLEVDQEVWRWVVLLNKISFDFSDSYQPICVVIGELEED